MPETVAVAVHLDDSRASKTWLSISSVAGLVTW